MKNINKIILPTIFLLLVVAVFYLTTQRKTTMDELANQDPELADIWHNFVNNEVSPKTNFDTTTLALIRLAATIAAQGQAEYKILLGEALDNGVDPHKIKEALYQAVPYAGMAKVRDFVIITNEIIHQRGIKLPLSPRATVTKENRLEKGIATQGAIFGLQAIENLRASAPDELKHIQDYLSANCFGDYYTRNGLDIKTRELLTFVILVSMGGAEPQAKAHAKANIDVGNNRGVLLDAVTQILPLIGYPRSLNAISVVNEVSQEN